MPGTKTEVRAKLAEYLESIRSNDALNALEGFDDFIASLEKLNNISDSFYQMSSQGPMQYLTKDNYRALLQAYETAEQACENFLKIPLTNGMKHPAQVVQEMLEQDMQHLGMLSFENGAVISLPMALDRARGYSVKVEEEVSSVGGAQSSRMKLAVVNANGKTINGYFTEDKLLDYQGDFQKVLLKMAKALSDCAEKYSDEKKKKLLSNAAEKLKEFENNERLAELFKYKDIPDEIKRQDDFPWKNYKRAPSFCNIGSDLSGSPWQWWYLGVDKQDAEAIIAMSKEISFGDEADQLKGALSNFHKELIGARTQYGLLHDELQLEDGVNIPRRNCAFSTLANMLGISDAAAASVLMEVDDNGVKKQGIFMENAKGTDLSKFSYGHPVGQHGIEDCITAGAKRKLAALQILDYLSSNADRHYMNISYVFDEDGRITDVQGFDNDSSFTTKKFNAAEKLHVLAALDNITVIPRDVADAVKMMTPEMLQHTLRSSLNEQEISAVWQRLEQLRGRLKEGNNRTFDEQGHLKLVPGTISVIEDNEWKDLKMQDLAALSEEDRKLLDKPADRKDISEDDPAVLKHGGYSCKNIFEVALLVPAHQRSKDIQAENQKISVEKRKNARNINRRYPMDEEQPKAVDEDALRAKVQDELLDNAHKEYIADATGTEIRKRGEKQPSYFTDAEEISDIAQIDPAADRQTVQNELTQLLTTDYVGGHKQYQDMKKALQDFTAKSFNAGNMKAYYKEMQNLYRCADNYYAYKKNPSNWRERLRVDVAARIKTFAKERVDQLRAHFERKDELKIYSTLDMTAGMARMIDKTDARIKQHSNGNANEAYLAEYHQTAMEGLNTLIGLSQKEALTDDDITTAYKSIAGMVIAELAERDFQREGTLKSSIAQHSKTADARKRNIDAMSNNFIFLNIFRDITPKKLETICSDPHCIDNIVLSVAKIRQNDQRAKQQKAAQLANASQKQQAPSQIKQQGQPEQSSFSILPNRQ